MIYRNTDLEHQLLMMREFRVWEQFREAYRRKKKKILATNYPGMTEAVEQRIEIQPMGRGFKMQKYTLLIMVAALMAATGLNAATIITNKLLYAKPLTYQS